MVGGAELFDFDFEGVDMKQSTEKHYDTDKNLNEVDEG